MGFGGLITAALSGAGKGIAQSAEDYQKQADVEANAARSKATELDLAKARADLQVEAARRIEEAQLAMKNKPNVTAGNYIKEALAAGVPVEAAPVTQLSGADPNSAYVDPSGAPTTGLTGDYASLKERLSRIPDPELRKTALDQLDRQLAADTAAAAQAVQGKTRPATREDAIAAAAERALAAGDVAAYNAAKALQGEKYIKVDENQTLLDKSGKVVYSNKGKDDRALELEDRKDARQERMLAAQERIAGLRIDAGEARADSRAEAADRRLNNKPLTQQVIKTIQEARENAVTLDRLNKDFKPDFASKGILGMGADMSMGAKAVLGTDKEAVDWWKNYRKQAELVERHAMFGASLTPGEQASWRSADVGPALDKDVIKKNLATRAELTKKMLENTAQDYIDAGYNPQRIGLIANRAIDQLGGEKPKTPDNKAPGLASSVPAGAVSYLRQNPALRAQFDAKYGAGAAKEALGE